MKHVILGAGNLGFDIAIELNRQRGFAPTILSRGTGFDLFHSDAMYRLLQLDCDVLWYCIGAGSVTESKSDWVACRQVHFYFPQNLLSAIGSKTKLVFFSTDYVANEDQGSDPQESCQHPLSQYARDKLYFEQYVSTINRPNTSVVRIGSLYGHHKPEKTFPGKILKNFSQGKLESQIRLPHNLVTPTSSRWAASIMVSNFNKMFHGKRSTRHHVAPSGNVAVEDWGKLILEKHRFRKDFFQGEGRFLDTERPAFSALGCTLTDVKPPHWYDVWKVYYCESWYHPRGDRP